MDLRASLRWHRWLAVPFGLMSLAMFGSFWADRGNPGVIFSFGLAGLMGWGALSCLLNTTRCYVTETELIVRHRPIPWPGLRLARSQIGAIITETEGDETVSWTAYAVLHDSSRHKLFGAPLAGQRYETVREAAEKLSVWLDVRLR